MPITHLDIHPIIRDHVNGEDITVQTHGHRSGLAQDLGLENWKGERTPEKFFSIIFEMMFMPVGLDDLERLSVAWKTGIPLDEPVRIHAGYSAECSWCGSKEYECDGFTISAVEPCAYPNGILMNVELEVPSGKLIIGNDFRDKFPGGDADFNVNAAHGIRDTVKAHAADQMLHFFVGNSCPSVYKIAKDTFTIASLTEEEDEQMQSVASVCTDLWWVSIIDADEATKRGMSHYMGNWTDNDPVEVTPGAYVLTYYALQKDFDHDAHSLVYAELRLKDSA